MDMLLIARALGANDVVSPTIPFVPPAVVYTPTPVASGGPSIILTSHVVTLKKGEKAKVQIVINTAEQEIKEFSFKIAYDKQLFSIVDADSATTGIQIPYANNFFKIKTNLVDPVAGTIEIKAAAASGTAPVTNRIIAEFEVLGLSEGVGEFKIDKNSSTLVNANNVNILNSVASVNVTVSTGTVLSSPTPTALPTVSSLTPKTALADDIGGVGSMVLGAFLVIAGIYFLKKKREYDILR
jgi:hypothetical protein